MSGLKLINSSKVSPIGKKVHLGRDFTIIGVVKDFNFRSLHNSVEPTMFYLSPNDYEYCFVRISPHNIKETRGYLESVWNRFAPDHPFEPRFVKDRFETLYLSEERMATLFNYFTLLTLFIACLGLFGLVSFIAQKRTKEIGIRKILGAEAGHIVKEFSKELLFPVTFSNFIAWPCAFILMNRWLENFAFRTGPAFWIFAAAAGAPLLIAMLTISHQSLKAALANPVDSLRYE